MQDSRDKVCGYDFTTSPVESTDNCMMWFPSHSPWNLLRFVVLLVLFANHALSTDVEESLSPHCLALLGQPIRVAVQVPEFVEKYAWLEHVLGANGSLAYHMARYGCVGLELYRVDTDNMYLLIQGKNYNLSTGSVSTSAAALSPVNFIVGSPGVLSAVAATPGHLSNDQTFGWLSLCGTVLSLSGRGPRSYTQQVGGVLFWQKTQPDEADTVDWAQFAQRLASSSAASSLLTLCATRHDSFQGYRIQALEALLRLERPLEQLATPRWVGSLDRVVSDLRSGLCQLGALPSGKLEHMAAAGLLRLSDFTIVSAPEADAGMGVGGLSSTRAYPEWAMITMPGVSHGLAALLSAELIGLHSWQDAMLSRPGFGFGLNYTEALLVEYQLNVSRDGKCPPGYQRQRTGQVLLCEVCAPGFFSQSFSTELCQPCKARTYSARAGATSCTQCSSGTTNYQEGGTGCTVSYGRQDTFRYTRLEGCSAWPNRTWTVGVLATSEEPEVQTLARWRPTFHSLLNNYMNRFQCAFRMQALRLAQLRQAAAAQQVDFLFLEAGAFTQLQYSDGARALATVVRTSYDHAYIQVGGCIFRRQDTLADVFTLQDVQAAALTRKLTLCALDRDSFVGFQVQAYEFLKAGIDIWSVFSEVVWAGSHQEAVRRVVAGECDIGLSRALDSLLVPEQQVQLVLINEQVHERFPLLVSTELYNEWPLAVLPHVPEDVWSNALIPLLALRDFEEAAVVGRHAGFMRAANFSREANVSFHLDLHGTGVCPPGHVRNTTLRLCMPCPASYYSLQGKGPCRSCTPGRFSKRGSTNCSRCPPGKGNLGYGAAECYALDTDEDDERPFKACQQFPNRTLVVGVVMAEAASLDFYYQSWQPVFDFPLNNFVKEYQCKFRLRVLSYPDVTPAVEYRQVDFLYSDPSQYVQHQLSHNLSLVASAVRLSNNYRLYHTFGGVVLRRADLNPDLTTFQALATASKTQSLTACIASRESFGGYSAIYYEFFKLGVDMAAVFSQFIVKGNYDEVVRAVYENECTVGMVRSSRVEDLLVQQLYQVEDFAIINAQTHRGFNDFVSTSLYAEWPLAALPHVPDDVTELVRQALITGQAWPKEATSVGRLGGFVVPQNYESVLRVRYQLMLEPKGSCGPGFFRNGQGVLGACLPCPAGSFSEQGVGPCVKCPSGWMSLVNGSSSCIFCPLGPDPMGSHCLVEIAKIGLKLPAQSAVFVFSGLLSMLCLSVFVLVHKNRHTTVMRASSAQFNLLLILACTMLCAFTTLFAIEPAPRNGVCALRWWLPCILASTVFGTLFSKTYRLYLYLEKGNSTDAVHFKDSKVAGMVLCFVLATAVMLSLYFLVAPPVFEHRYVQLALDPGYTAIPACRVNQVFVSVIFSLYALVLMGMCWLAVQVRKLPDVFNESKLIAWLLYNTIFVGLVGIMVDMMLEQTQPNARMLIRSIALLIGSTTPVLVLYGPKLNQIYRTQTDQAVPHALRAPQRRRFIRTPAQSDVKARDKAQDEATDGKQQEEKLHASEQQDADGHRQQQAQQARPDQAGSGALERVNERNFSFADRLRLSQMRWSQGGADQMASSASSPSPSDDHDQSKQSQDTPSSLEEVGVGKLPQPMRDSPADGGGPNRDAAMRDSRDSPPTSSISGSVERAVPIRAPNAFSSGGSWCKRDPSPKLSETSASAQEAGSLNLSGSERAGYTGSGYLMQPFTAPNLPRFLEDLPPAPSGPVGLVKFTSPGSMSPSVDEVVRHNVTDSDTPKPHTRAYLHHPHHSFYQIPTLEVDQTREVDVVQVHKPGK
eukprot:g43417.t1